MNELIIKTLVALDNAKGEGEAHEVLRQAFNRVKSHNILTDVAPFDAGDSRPRLTGKDASGAGIIVLGSDPKVGDLIENGGVSYYVESLINQQEQIAKAQQRDAAGGSADPAPAPGAKPANRPSPAAK